MSDAEGEKHRGNTEAVDEGKARRLANLRPPWKPGESGNPKGRPKHRTVTEELVKIFDHPASEVKTYEKVARLLGLDPATTTIREVVAHAMIAHGLKGQPTVLVNLIDRIDGKVADRIAGHDGGPLKIQALLDALLDDPEAMRQAGELAERLQAADAGGEDTEG